MVALKTLIFTILAPGTVVLSEVGFLKQFPANSKEGIPTSFRLNRRERLSSCNRVTQQVRSTAVGNTSLGKTVLPTHVKEPEGALRHKQAGLGRNKLSFYGNRCILWGCRADFDLCLKP